MSLRVAVVQGGPSIEAEVSRSSAAAVHAALLGVGHHAERLELDAELPFALRAGAYDVVFPVTHGALGEDGCLQGLLEVLGLPYVGSDVVASALAANKPHAKLLFRAAGLPVADEHAVRRGSDLAVAARELRSRLGAAVVVKPGAGGSGLGVTRVAATEPDGALIAALERALDDDPIALCERFVVGLEVTCGVYEGDGEAQALPPTQILAKAADWYDFTSRYAAGGSEHRCPAPVSPELTARIQAVALGAHQALGCRDLSRVDFVVGDGEDHDAVTLLEVNTLPGMTATSLFPEAASVAGISFPTLCDALARRAHTRAGVRRVNVRAMP